MRGFIEVHTWDRLDKEKCKRLINTEYIVAVFPKKPEDKDCPQEYSILHFSDGENLVVRESYGEIRELLARATAVGSW